MIIIKAWSLIMTLWDVKQWAMIFNDCKKDSVIDDLKFRYY